LESNLRKPAVLVLEDGNVFKGVSIGANGQTAGEVVFNTTMTGYQEILTDPSYTKQIVVFTYPHIGNTGINDFDNESNTPKLAGLVIRDLALTHSNWRSNCSLEEYLVSHDIVAIAEIDTRRLTRLIREKGVLKGCIVAGEEYDINFLKAQAKSDLGVSAKDLTCDVTCSSTHKWGYGTWDLETNSCHKKTNGKYHVVVYDFGVKHNILRILRDKHCRVTQVPATTPPKDTINLKPDGILLSNGPGNPECCTDAIRIIKTLLEKNIPIFGICLGYQLLSIACEAKTEKMMFGHHGSNHPVQDIATGNVLITSQNHGYVISEQTLPTNIKITHRSLFDNTIQGIALTNKPAFGFQGHPEASPGPVDVVHLFDRFTSMMDETIQGHKSL